MTNEAADTLRYHLVLFTLSCSRLLTSAAQSYQHSLRFGFVTETIGSKNVTVEPAPWLRSPIKTNPGSVCVTQLPRRLWNPKRRHGGIVPSATQSSFSLPYLAIPPSLLQRSRWCPAVRRAMPPRRCGRVQSIRRGKNTSPASARCPSRRPPTPAR